MPPVERDEFRIDQRDLRDDMRRNDLLEAMMDDARRDMGRPERPIEPIDRIAAVVNDPLIKVTPTLVKIINDPKMGMMPNGDVVKIIKPGKQMTPSSVPSRLSLRGRSSIREFGIRDGKRTRKKTKMDRSMSICLKEANAKLRNKNGKLKKGKTMGDVMRMAHRLCRKRG